MFRKSCCVRYKAAVVRTRMKRRVRSAGGSLGARERTLGGTERSRLGVGAQRGGRALEDGCSARRVSRGLELRGCEEPQQGRWR